MYFTNYLKYNILIAVVLLNMFPCIKMVHAEPVALIMTVGEYQHPRISSLPGTKKDSFAIQNLAREFGIKRHIVLKDQEVTLSSVRSSFAKLRQIAGPNDLVWVYYSGHGLQIPDESGDEDGDEPDHKDEVLTMYDTGIGKGGKVINVLVDDEINYLMKSLKSKHQWLIVDACHSGTISKHSDFKYTAKEVSVHQLPELGYQGKISLDPSLKKNLGSEFTSKGSSYLVSLSAAKDNEQSLDTKAGGLFTNSLINVARSLKCNQRTPRNLIEKTQATISKLLAGNPHRLFHPQLTTNSYGETQIISKTCNPSSIGSTSLSSNSTSFKPPKPSNELKKLKKLVNKNGCNEFKINANQSKYSIRNQEELILTITGKRNGYINIFSLNREGVSTVYYPNQFTKNDINKFNLSNGSIRIPNEKMREQQFKLIAEAPETDEYIVAIWTQDPLNLYESSQNKEFSNVSSTQKELLEYALEVHSKDVDLLKFESDQELKSKKFGIRPTGIPPRRKPKISRKKLCASAVEVQIRQ